MCVCSLICVCLSVRLCLCVSVDIFGQKNKCDDVWFGRRVTVSLCLVPNTRMESIIQKGGISYIGFGLDLFGSIEKKVAGSVKDGWA